MKVCENCGGHPKSENGGVCDVCEGTGKVRSSYTLAMLIKHLTDIMAGHGNLEVFVVRNQAMHPVKDVEAAFIDHWPGEDEKFVSIEYGDRQ